MEERLGVELEIIDVYVQMGNPKDQILMALDELEMSALSEGLNDLAQKIEDKIKELE